MAEDKLVIKSGHDAIYLKRTTIDCSELFDVKGTLHQLKRDDKRI